MASFAREDLQQALPPLCTDVPPDVLRDFVTRMDDDYLRRVPLQTIAQHVRSIFANARSLIVVTGTSI
jgi:hypothetical protein